MRSFIITLEADEFGESKRIDFDALDPQYAFQLLEREKVGRNAILWEGETRIGSLRRTQVGAWQIAR